MHFRLHSRYQNSAGERVRIALNLKNIDYDYAPVQSVAGQDYRRINPHGLMPALDINGQIVTQSIAIMELLEELFPEPPILPREPVLRAQVRAFAHAISADLHPINNNRIRRYLRETMAQDDHQVTDWYHHWIATSFAALEGDIAGVPGGKAFCFTDTPTMADICLVPQMANARRFNCNLTPYPRLVAVDAACRRMDAFQRAAPEVQPDFPERP